MSGPFVLRVGGSVGRAGELRLSGVLHGNPLLGRNLQLTKPG